MTHSLFLSGAEVWQETAALLRSATSVYAAIAYLGTGASKLAPLRRGSVLVVDMSLRAVSQGVTDPKEVRILIRRGVKVFTRSNLHAKLLVMDQTLVVGSANASRNAAKVLDEAALVTRDPAAVRLALSFIDDISTEPVRPRYLRECLKAYRPPRFKSAIPHHGARNAKRERRAKLWIIGGLVPFDPPEAEEAKAESAKARAERLQQRPESTYVDQLFYPNRSRLIDGLKRGDWAVTGMREKNTITVWPPRQLLSIENYARGAGKQRWTLQLEAPNSEQLPGSWNCCHSLLTDLGNSQATFRAIPY